MYAYYTDTDWRYTRGLVAVILSQCIGFILMDFILNITFLEMVVCFFFTLLFGVYLVYDTQIILGTKNEMIEMDNYILGAFILYTDIVYIFMKILELLQYLENKE